MPKSKLLSLFSHCLNVVVTWSIHVCHPLPLPTHSIVPAQQLQLSLDSLCGFLRDFFVDFIRTIAQVRILKKTKQKIFSVTTLHIEFINDIICKQCDYTTHTFPCYVVQSKRVDIRSKCNVSTENNPSNKYYNDSYTRYTFKNPLSLTLPTSSSTNTFAAPLVHFDCVHQNFDVLLFFIFCFSALCSVLIFLIAIEFVGGAISSYQVDASFLSRFGLFLEQFQNFAFGFFVFFFHHFAPLFCTTNIKEIPYTYETTQNSKFGYMIR